MRPLERILGVGERRRRRPHIPWTLGGGADSTDSLAADASVASAITCVDVAGESCTILGGPTYSDGVADVVGTLARSQGMPEHDLKAAVIATNQTSLLERFIEPAEIASLALYLASPLSSATNGAALRADGGVLTAMV